MTVEQFIGFWLVVAGMVVAIGTTALVVVGLCAVLTKQDERRYGLRRGWSRSEPGVGWRGPAVDGPTDREILARVGWVGIESIKEGR